MQRAFFLAILFLSLANLFGIVVGGMLEMLEQAKKELFLRRIFTSFILYFTLVLFVVHRITHYRLTLSFRTFWIPISVAFSWTKFCTQCLY